MLDLLHLPKQDGKRKMKKWKGAMEKGEEKGRENTKESKEQRIKEKIDEHVSKLCYKIFQKDKFIKKFPCY